jgi:glycosyltransferase involved in cell wall biosynthesis
MNNDLCIVIPIKNEESKLYDCLKSIGNDFAKDIFILDSNSTDESIAIAKQFNTKVIQFDWNGKYPKKRNWFLINHTESTEWILFLDADERLTPEVKTEISLKIKNKDVEGFWLNYANYINNYKLKGGYPLKKLALFKRHKYLYENIGENNWSNLDMEIHEHPIIHGKIGFIHAQIDHKIDSNYKRLWRKHIEYANWEGKRFFDLRENQYKTSLTKNQKIKYFLLKNGILPPVYFIGTYIFLLGFLDGKNGIIYSIIKFRYFKKVGQIVKKLNREK